MHPPAAMSQRQGGAWSGGAVLRIAAAGGYGFAILGITDTALGVAWPAVRQTFGEPLSALSLLLLAAALGYVSTAVPNGHLLNRFGPTLMLITSSAGACAACALLACAPAFWVLVAAELMLGAASGALDAGLNTMVANQGPASLLNALHGAFGVGTVVGPVLVTLAVVSAGSWRMPYAIMFAAEAVCALSWRAVRKDIDAGEEPGAQAGQTPGNRAAAGLAGQPSASALGGGKADRGRTRALLPVITAVAVGLVYAGAQFSAGQWAASYLRQVTKLDVTDVGLTVAGYWGAFAVLTLALALSRRQLAAATLMRAGCVVALLGGVMLWLGRGAALTVAAFAVIGAGLAPVFPSLLIMTARRLGAAWARHVIGWQLAAAGAGGQALSALTGGLLGGLGLAALGPILVVMILLTLAGVLLVSGSLGRVAAV